MSSYQIKYDKLLCFYDTFTTNHHYLKWYCVVFCDFNTIQLL